GGVGVHLGQEGVQQFQKSGQSPVGFILPLDVVGENLNLDAAVPQAGQVHVAPAGPPSQGPAVDDVQNGVGMGVHHQGVPVQRLGRLHRGGFHSSSPSEAQEKRNLQVPPHFMTLCARQLS